MDNMDVLYYVSQQEVSEMVYLYTQLYAMPLVLMFILSAMTVYRREMSCNRVYALEDGANVNNYYHNNTATRRSTTATVAVAEAAAAPAPSSETEHEPNQQQYSHDNDNDEVSGSGTRGLQIAKPYLFSPLVAPAPATIVPTPTASTPTPPAASARSSSSRKRPTTGAASTGSLRRPDTRINDIMKIILADVFRLTWTEESNEAFSRLSEYLYDSMAGVSAYFILPTRRKRRSANPSHLHPDQFPADVQVNIFSFLHPKDVVTFACASKACQKLVDGGGEDDSPVTRALWKTLWLRDYGWIIQSWEVGRGAYLRSNVLEPAFGKEFYFRFGLGYLNYLLAGWNKPEKCLVGLHGNIYDITDFVIRHPGSPETLFVHAGRDASMFFDDMDHSRRARRLAKDFCIAVDGSYGIGDSRSYGLKPTAEFQADGPTPAVVDADPVIGKKERRYLCRESLKNVYEAFLVEEYRHRKEFKQKMKALDDVLHANIFYDPFREEWTGWYTSRDFETVFV